MQKNYQKPYWAILFLPVLSLMIFCAPVLRQEKPDVSIEKKENDLINLLNANQEDIKERVEDPEIEQLKLRIAELEKDNEAGQGEINRLKSELMLKNEKLKQLEAVETVETKDPAPETKNPRVTSKMLTDFEKDYVRGLDLFMAKKYDESYTLFERLLNNNRNHNLSDNCEYWIGECYFARKNYQKAIVAFEKVFTYLNSNKDDDAQIKLGICYFKMNDLERAKIEFNKLLDNYPKSEYVNRAQYYLSRIS